MISILNQFIKNRASLQYLFYAHNVNRLQQVSMSAVWRRYFTMTKNVARVEMCQIYSAEILRGRSLLTKFKSLEFTYQMN